MKEIQNILQSQSERLLYLDLKKSLQLNDKEYKDLSLPIVREDFIDEIQEGNFEEEIHFDHFLKGMIFNISIDPDFVYSNRYKEIINEALPEVENYLFSKGLMELEYSNDAIHYFRTNYLLGSRMVLNSYYYVLALENFDEGQDVVKTEDARRWLLDEIIESDPDFPLSYYRLALYALKNERFEEAFDYFIKSKNLLKDCDYPLPKSYIDEIDADISFRLEELSSQSLLKKAVNHLDMGEFYESLEILNDLNRRIDSPIVKYYLGFTYRNLNEIDLAIELYEEAQKEGFNGLELYQDLSYSYYAHGELENTLKIINQGLEIYQDNAQLLYNRAALNINLDNIDDALEDLETIISYDDISDEIFNQAMILREKIMNYKEDLDDL